MSHRRDDDGTFQLAEDTRDDIKNKESINVDIPTSLPLYRAFRTDIQLAHQLMHIHKIVYIKTIKIAPTCFDPKIIFRGATLFLEKIIFLKYL